MPRRRCYNGRRLFVAISPIVPIRHAEASDLPRIVDIYNASIPGRAATADLQPVSVDSRKAWFEEFDPARRPLWVHCDNGALTGWLSVRSFYGRPAYHATAETSVYMAPEHQRRGIGRALLTHAIVAAPTLGLRTLLAFVFGHNVASVTLYRGGGFQEWGALPRVAELDGMERDLLILGLRVDGSGTAR